MTDGAATLEALSTLNPDVMILDWNLGVKNAREVLQMARSPSTNPNPNLPIIILSSSGQIDYVQEAMKHGTPYFMVWPISPKMLQQRLLGNRDGSSEDCPELHAQSSASEASSAPP